jgi:hypothetical protein
MPQVHKASVWRSNVLENEWGRLVDASRYDDADNNAYCIPQP